MDDPSTFMMLIHGETGSSSFSQVISGRGSAYCRKDRTLFVFCRLRQTQLGCVVVGQITGEIGPLLSFILALGTLKCYAHFKCCSQCRVMNNQNSGVFVFDIHYIFLLKVISQNHSTVKRLYSMCVYCICSHICRLNWVS